MVGCLEAFDGAFILRGAYSSGAVDGVVIVIDIWGLFMICVVRDLSVSEMVVVWVGIMFFSSTMITDCESGSSHVCIRVSCGGGCVG